MSTPSSTVQIFNPSNHPSLSPAYSHISIAPLSPGTDLISLAGQTGTDLTTTSANAPTFPQQVRTALKNVDKCLAAVGCTKADIISNRQYVVKLAALKVEDGKARADIFLEWWRSTEEEKLPPPDTLIGVDSLYSGETLFEIEVTAVRVRGEV